MLCLEGGPAKALRVPDSQMANSGRRSPMKTSENLGVVGQLIASLTFGQLEVNSLVWFW
jgi:hypothetical protein